MRGSTLRILGTLLRVVAAIVPQDLPLAVDPGEDVGRTFPHPLEVQKRVSRMVQLQIDTFVLVLEQELPAVVEVPVLDVDERLAVVGQAEQELLLHLLELAALDLVVAGALVVTERIELLLLTELEREVLVEERDVVVELPD